MTVKERSPHRVLQSFGGVLLSLALLAGCASKSPQGYGVSQRQSTAAMAQAQMQAAEQATQLDTTKTYLDLIAQMQQSGQWYASLAHAEAFVAQHGPLPEVQILRADALRNTQQHAAAHQLYTSLIATSQASRAHRGLGLLEAAQGQYSQAIAALEKARQLNPIDANVLSDIGYAYMLNGQLDQAQLPVLQASQLAPDNARVQLNQALFWLASGEQARAMQFLEQMQRPQNKTRRPLIDGAAIERLNEQLQVVNAAVQARQQSRQQPVAADEQGKVMKVSEFIGSLPLAPVRQVDMAIAANKE